MSKLIPCRVCATPTKVAAKQNSNENPRVHHYCSDKCAKFGTKYNSYTLIRLRKKWQKDVYQEKLYNRFILGTLL